MDQIGSFEAMLARGQDSEMLRYTLGNAYFKDGQFDKAVEHLQAAVRLKPDYSVAWRLLGRSLSASEQAQEALAAFDEGLRIAQDNGDLQALKEMQVFRKRVVRQLKDAEHQNVCNSQGNQPG